MPKTTKMQSLSRLNASPRFWTTALFCPHDRIHPKYLVQVLCESPGCIAHETRCLVCGAFLTKCSCGKQDIIGRWPRMTCLRLPPKEVMNRVK